MPLYPPWALLVVNGCAWCIPIFPAGNVSRCIGVACCACLFPSSLLYYTRRICFFMMKGSKHGEVSVMEVHRTTVVWPQPKQRLGVMVTIPLPCQAVNCGGTETRPQSRCNSSTSSILGMLLFGELPRARNLSGFPKDDGHVNFFKFVLGRFTGSCALTSVFRLLVVQLVLYVSSRPQKVQASGK